MAKTRELRRRIRSVEKTRQSTKTMEMVAASRLKRAQDRVVSARPYAQALADVLGDLFDPALAERFPVLRVLQGKPRRVALIGLTSNRGLCGAFNANLIRETLYRTEELEAQGYARLFQLALVEGSFRDDPRCYPLSGNFPDFIDRERQEQSTRR